MVKPTFHGEAMLRRANANGEAVFILDDTEALRSLMARDGRVNQRFAMVLVHIDDEGNPAASPPDDPQFVWGVLDMGQKVLRRTEEKARSNQAALLCKDLAFGWYIISRYDDIPVGVVPRPREEEVVKRLREYLRIESRAELDYSIMSAAWRQLLGDYRLWLDEEKRRMK